MTINSNRLDLMSSEELEDPSLSAQKLLNGSPTYYYDLYNPPFYILSRYTDVRAALHDPETFMEGLGNGPNFVESNGILSDGKHHTLIRRVVQPNFLMGSISNLEKRLVEIAEELLENVSEKEVWDIHDDLSFPLPVIIICEILGIPTDDIKRFKRWADASVAQMCSEDPLEFVEELNKKDDYFLDLIIKKRGEPEEDVLLSKIAHAKIDSEYLSDDEAVNLASQIFVAGNETTTSLISNLIWRMLTFENLWQDFVGNKINIDDAINESLRFDPPLLGLFKTTTRDVDINGSTIPKNTKVLMHYGAANRDPKIFNNPNEFIISRDGSKVISFSVGIHICLGRELAKLETRVALNALRKKFPNLRLINNGERVGPFLFWGRSKLPVSNK
ncbi:MAG: cytochrome P450 [Pseudomonadota bacterium]|nr:cytochrome P450 [Pseudomonadota bacterium]